MNDLVGRFLFLCRPRGKKLPTSSWTANYFIHRSIQHIKRLHELAHDYPLSWSVYKILLIICFPMPWLLIGIHAATAQVMQSKQKHGFSGGWSVSLVVWLGGHIYHGMRRWDSSSPQLGFLLPPVDLQKDPFANKSNNRYENVHVPSQSGLHFDLQTSKNPESQNSSKFHQLGLEEDHDGATPDEMDESHEVSESEMETDDEIIPTTELAAKETNTCWYTRICYFIHLWVFLCCPLHIDSFLIPGSWSLDYVSSFGRVGARWWFHWSSTAHPSRIQSCTTNHWWKVEINVLL